MVSSACFLCTSGVSNENTEIEIDEVDEIHKQIDESYMTFVNSYVKLPEGKSHIIPLFTIVNPLLTH